MAKQVTQLGIFFSGTSECVAEQAALKSLIEEMNRTIEKVKQVQFKVIGWPDSFRPGLSTEPQAVINSQVEGCYDIYIGMLGSKFGTPTKGASSGTEEEFKAAVCQFSKDTTSVRVLFYFKRSPVDPFQIETTQLGKVQQFRSRLAEQGVLFQDFNDTAEFVDVVRGHLTDLVVDEWESTSWKYVDLVSNGAAATVETEIESMEALQDFEDSTDELGYIELIEEFQAAMDSITLVMEKITEYTLQVGAQFIKHTESSNYLVDTTRNKGFAGSREANEYLSKAKKIVNNAAADLDSYTENITPYVSHVKTDFEKILVRFRDVCMLSDKSEEDNHRKTEYIAGLEKLLETISSAVANITNFQESIVGLPSLTTKFAKSRKLAAVKVGELIAEMKIATKHGSDIIDEIRNS